MNVAVLTLTRDRLPYTQHCFQTLRDKAGCEFDWFVLDQGSTDDTPGWLLDQDDITTTLLDENIGICRGLNLLLAESCDPADYDVLVRFDNDCEVLTPDTLRIACEAAADHQAIVAPRVLGLNNPPPTVCTLQLDNERWLDVTQILGGIFMCIPAQVFTSGFRYDERFPAWTGDEAVVPWWQARGGLAGYLHGIEVNHYLTTEGQKQSDPGYFKRKDREYLEAAG